MSQFDFGTIDPQVKDGTQLADDLNQWRDAIHSSHWGPTRPPYVRPGMSWVSTATSPDMVLFMFDGTADIPIFFFNTTTHVGSAGDFVPRTGAKGSAVIPAGTAPERDAAPAPGYFRFNTDTTSWEGWNGTAWVGVGGGQMFGVAQNKAIFYNNQTISEDLTVLAGSNGGSFGPVTVNNGFTVTVSNGSVWSVV